MTLSDCHGQQPPRTLVPRHFSQLLQGEVSWNRSMQC